MKHWIFSFVLLLYCSMTFAQQDFTGMAKYIMTVEGDSTHRKDSMAVIFGKDKIKIILYMPNTNNWGVPYEKIFIDDFTSQSTLDIDSEKGTYSVIPLKCTALYEFVNTNRFDAVRRFLCMSYEADPLKIDKTVAMRATCLGSIDYFKPTIKNYFFLGVQPLVIDNRIVMDFKVTQPNGLKPRVYLYDLQKIDDTAPYFNLDGLTETR